MYPRVLDMMCVCVWLCYIVHTRIRMQDAQHESNPCELSGYQQ